jgi:hypothetical protein
MNLQLTHVRAQQHIADLQRAADAAAVGRRRRRAASSVKPGPARRRVLLLVGSALAVLALVVLPAGSASAAVDQFLNLSATTVGQTGGGLNCDSEGGFVWADANFVVRAGGGTITSFSFQSSTLDSGVQLDFLILRPTATARSYTVVGTTGLVTLRGTGLEMFPADNISVEGGDILGYWTSAAAFFNCGHAVAGDKLIRTNATADPGVNDTIDFPGFVMDFGLNEAANLEVPVPTDDPAVTGTLGNNGWYTSKVSVAWNWTDADGPGVDASNCTQTSDSGSTEGSVTLSPLSQTVNITCSPSDATSGIDSTVTSCPGASGPAWTFGAGSHTLNANATDNAGNTGSSSTIFTVIVTVGPLCQLTSQFVDGSAKYQALGAKQQAVINALSNAACNEITRITAKLTAAQTAVLIKAYQAAVKALGASGWLTGQQVSTLNTLATAL